MLDNILTIPVGVGAGSATGVSDDRNRCRLDRVLRNFLQGSCNSRIGVPELARRVLPILLPITFLFFSIIAFHRVTLPVRQFVVRQFDLIEGGNWDEAMKVAEMISFLVLSTAFWTNILEDPNDIKIGLSSLVGRVAGVVTLGKFVAQQALQTAASKVKVGKFVAQQALQTAASKVKVMIRRYWH